MTHSKTFTADQSCNLKPSKKSIFAKVLSLSLLLSMLCTLLCSCSIFKFEVYSCGSGFYLNKSPNRTYKIKALDAESTENYFYLSDYFVSESLGTEYKIKRGLFNIGSVYLAKKADYYNPKKFSFNLDTYESDIIKITSDMSYVEIYSSNPNKEHNIQIHIESRSIPVDITFRNVCLVSPAGVPVIFSKAACDINLIAEGTNVITAGTAKLTLEEWIKKVRDDALSAVQKEFISAVKVVSKEFSYLKSVAKQEETLGEVSAHYFQYITDLELTLLENAWDKFIGVLGGKTGSPGKDGTTAILAPCGISIAGKGSIDIKGASGGNGGNASASLTGQANGGTGGNGGDAISCSNYLEASTVTVKLEGGFGGNGGEPSKSGFGLFGSSGNKGASGKKGEDIVED